MKINMRITHTVIKNSDVDKYLSVEQTNNLIDILQTICQGRKKDGKPTDNEYIICNMDEPYANEVLTVIRKAESEDNNEND